MKALQTVSAVAFVIGLFLIAGAIGADDVAVMTHTKHSIDYMSMIIGLVACVPLVLFGGDNESRKNI